MKWKPPVEKPQEETEQSVRARDGVCAHCGKPTKPYEASIHNVDGHLRPIHDTCLWDWQTKTFIEPQRQDE